MQAFILELSVQYTKYFCVVWWIVLLSTSIKWLFCKRFIHLTPLHCGPHDLLCPIKSSKKWHLTSTQTLKSQLVVHCDLFSASLQVVEAHVKVEPPSAWAFKQLPRAEPSSWPKRGMWCVQKINFYKPHWIFRLLVIVM